MSGLAGLPGLCNYRRAVSRFCRNSINFAPHRKQRIIYAKKIYIYSKPKLKARRWRGGWSAFNFRLRRFNEWTWTCLIIPFRGEFIFDTRVFTRQLKFFNRKMRGRVHNPHSTVRKDELSWGSSPIAALCGVPITGRARLNEIKKVHK